MTCQKPESRALLTCSPSWATGLIHTHWVLLCSGPCTKGRELVHTWKVTVTATSSFFNNQPGSDKRSTQQRRIIIDELCYDIYLHEFETTQNSQRFILTICFPSRGVECCFKTIQMHLPFKSINDLKYIYMSYLTSNLKYFVFWFLWFGHGGS